jgi:hypothetical protein
MSDEPKELFAVPSGGKPSLIVARERLVVADAYFLKAVTEGDATATVEFWRNELREAKAEVRRLELVELEKAKAGV